MDTDQILYRTSYELRALVRADALCDHGIHNGQLAPDAPVPRWLHDKLRGATLYAPQGPWPEFARTEHPVDWPRLFDEHRGNLDLDDNLASNAAVPWPDVRTAFVALQQAGHTPRLDVALSVDAVDRIAIFYNNIGVTNPSTLRPDTITTIDALLVDAGRPADHLHDKTPESSFCWRLAG